MERLQKVLARAGVASRRSAEELIKAGRVCVNGQVVTQLGAQVDPADAVIEVDGQRIGGESSPVYVLLNKPKGCVTTRSDPQGRATVMDLLPPQYQHLHPVGRLDFDTEGLLLLTNDGGLTFALTHPRHEVRKTYRARVRGPVPPAALQRLERGVQLEDGATAPARTKLLRQHQSFSEVEITIHEGRKRQVRRMMEALGHPVIALRRVRLGALTLGKLRVGEWRLLTPGEAEGLKQMARGKSA